MMGEREAAALLEEAARRGIDVWLDGGWGVDALVGEQTRPHDDLDVFVRRRDEAAFVALLEAEGFSEAPRAFTMEDHTAWEAGDGRVVDLHVFEFADDGSLVFLGERYPASAFSGRGTVGGVEVRCIPAAEQVAFHCGYDFDADDVRDVRLLCERFGVPVPEEYRDAMRKEA